MNQKLYPTVAHILAVNGKRYGKTATLHAAEMEADIKDLGDADMGIPTAPPGDAGAGEGGGEECSQEVDDLGLVHQHCEKMGLGDKEAIAVEDKMALELALKEAGHAELAQYIAVMDPVEFEDFVVNTIFG